MQTYQQEPVVAKKIQKEQVIEAPRQTPIRESVDVLVCGGGPAGVGAALMAAREGARVLLIERFGMLGGMWTAGLVNPFFAWQEKGAAVQELKTRLDKAGAWRTWQFAHTFDAEVMRLTLEQMMEEHGVAFRYYTLVADTIVEDGRIRGIVTESKAGREAILADVVIDATGDGDVAARCGCRYELGRSCDGRVQPVTLMFEITGADQFNQENTAQLYDLLAEGMTEQEKSEIMPFGRAGNVPWIITTPSGLSAVQATHIYRVNPLDPCDLTRGVVHGRAMMHKMIAVMRKIPVFAHARITQSASALGVREGRRILGRDRVVFEHTQRGQRFEDSVAVSCFGLDIHDPAPGSKIPSGDGHAEPFEIPYGCIVPQDVEGLVLAGRCISGDHRAHSSYRVTGTAMALGQAAGLAASQAVRQGILPSALDGRKVHAALQSNGVVFLKR